MRRLLFYSLTAPFLCLANTIPGPSISDNIVLCNTNNTSCTFLVPQNSPGAVSFAGPVNGGGTTITLNGLADATGGPGNLKAYSSYNLSPASSYFSQFQSNAEFRDNVTITSASQPTGSLGYLVFAIAVNGSATASGLGDAGILWQDSVGTAGAAVASTSNCPGPVDTNGVCYVTGNATLLLNPVPFHFGDPIWLDFFIGAGTYPGASFPSGTADYSHTARLTQFQVLDSTMTSVSNPSFASTAGVQYTVNGVAPEPGAIFLVGIGLVIGIFRYRKRSIKPPAV